MLDFPTQLTIGTFLSTGVYCLLVLRIVEKQDGLPVPHLSVALAVGLNLLSMGLLIYFLHHVAVLIQAPHIVSAVAADLDDSIDRLFPERIGQNDADDEADDDRDVQRLAEKLGDGYDTVESTLEGYIQAIDASGVVCLAEHHDLVIQLLKRPGDYLSRGEPITRIWRVGDAAPENLPELINDLFIVGMRRTPRQDVECAIEELVEVAVRSLSPGINDPFTAVNCIDYLGSTLGRLAERKAPKSARYDESGCLRVLAPGVTFPNALDAAFNQIRQYGKDCPAVMIRLLEVFRSILRQTVRNCDRQAVLDHADMVMRAAERSIPEERDLEAVRERLQALEAFREPD